MTLIGRSLHVIDTCAPRRLCDCPRLLVSLLVGLFKEVLKSLASAVYRLQTPLFGYWDVECCCRSAGSLLWCVRVCVCACVCLCVRLAPFAIISFPFLFSVMFGDTGHGILMFVAALWMVILEKKFLQMKSDNEVSSVTHRRTLLSLLGHPIFHTQTQYMYTLECGVLLVQMLDPIM